MSAETTGWRYRKGDVDGGEVGWERLQVMARSGDLADEDYVYWPERGRWVKAWEVPGLFDLDGQVASHGLDAAAARRRRILFIVIAADVAVTLIVGIVILVVFAST